MPWATGRTFLDQLTIELTAAVKAGTLPIEVSEDLVWVRVDGRPVLLDAPVGLPKVSPLAGSDADRAVGLLRRVAGLVLEGVARPAAGSKTLVAARIPRRAERAVSALLRGSENSRAVLRAWHDDLGTQFDRPVAVSRAARLLYLFLQGLVAVFVLSSAFSLPSLHEVLMTKTAATPPDDGTLSAAVREYADLRLVVECVNPDPLVRLTSPPVWKNDHDVADQLDRISTDRRDHPSALRDNLGPLQRLMWASVPTMYQQRPNARGEVARKEAEFRVRIAAGSSINSRQMPFLVSCVLSGGSVSLWMILSFVSRGGLLLRMTGAAVVRRDGRSAGRFRCAARTLVTWIPFLGLVHLSILIKLPFAINEPLPGWVWGASVGCWWAGWAVLVAQLVQIAARPDRSFADRAVGTWLVPN